MKIIENNLGIEKMNTIVKIVVSSLYKNYSHVDNTYKIRTTNSSATIIIGKEKVTLKGASIIITNCYNGIKEEINNGSLKLGNRFSNRMCDGPTCSCGLCQTFFK